MKRTQQTTNVHKLTQKNTQCTPILISRVFSLSISFLSLCLAQTRTTQDNDALLANGWYARPLEIEIHSHNNTSALIW